MTLEEVSQKIDKSKTNEDYIDLEILGSTLGIDSNEIVDEEIDLKCYWVGNWYCTDSYVGYRMYFFRDKPVAFSIQRGRKLNEEIHWFSLSVANEVKDYLLTLILKSKIKIPIININEDVGIGYKINYNSQILEPYMITYNDEQIKILEKIKHDAHGLDTKLRIELLNKEEKIVEIDDLMFGFHTRK